MFQRNGKTRDTNGLGITDRGNNWVPTEREKEIKREGEGKKKRKQKGCWKEMRTTEKMKKRKKDRTF